APLAPPLVPQLAGERVDKLPGFAEPFALGPAPVVAALALAGTLAVALLAFRARRSPRLFAALVVGFACTYTILFQAVLPRLDERFSAPLRRLAVQAAALVPADQRVVMLDLRRRPSVCFYGDRQTESVGTRAGLDPEAPLYRSAEGRVGLTRAALIPRFPATLQVEVLAQDLGFALFRARPVQAAR
ncbi:MAG: hypothetical protein WEF50_16835, partial [Myxococcota bacterium]